MLGVQDCASHQHGQFPAFGDSDGRGDIWSRGLVVRDIREEDAAETLFPDVAGGLLGAELKGFLPSRGLDLAVPDIDGGGELFSEPRQELVHNKRRSVEDGAHQQPCGAEIEEELRLIGAPDASSHLDAGLRLGLAEAAHDLGDEFPVMPLTPCGIHVQEAEAVVATIQKGRGDLHGIRIDPITPGARHQASVLDLEGGQNLQRGHLSQTHLPDLNP